ncbi:phosphoadenosine phosphosulfate reductase family protein [Pseudomonas sp.]|uniref:phosphoadenosine phosphosulfate reductase family protein n=1 Tax=Pseudomonas sp. TaxID=306 RepID=UPI00290DB4A0|nr:phosphoadenosine phosphosulfate reductase family protein [Pseudomonas sp.]MDU4254508.1 phosphoadenosine phosphosulfate reductase family protein [Pseudomonas sp.]
MSHLPPVAITPIVAELLDRNAVVAVGVSGGKDSDACAIATDEYLDRIGHTGPRLLIHADLGSVEWRQSLPKCEQLAARLGWELVTVARKAGGMMARWETRWQNNVTRYNELSCVKLILPWSTPGMRFCTSELKAAVIASYLKKRFKGQPIINVTGIRREESASRKKADIAKADPRLAQGKIEGITWNPVIEWKIDEVKAAIASRGLVLHEAYTRYQMSRVSCVFCIMSSAADLIASTTCPDNHDIYRTMVELEATSTFAFQSKNWLGDVAPQLLGGELADRLELAKKAAAVREMAEARIPVGLEYQQGWPTRRPSLDEARIIADVRQSVAGAVGLSAGYLDPYSIMDRYDQLMQIKADKTPSVPVQLLGSIQSDQMAFGF